MWRYLCVSGHRVSQRVRCCGHGTARLPPGPLYNPRPNQIGWFSVNDAIWAHAVWLRTLGYVLRHLIYSTNT